MITPYGPAPCPEFVGREFELAELASSSASKGAKIIVVYGRRRVGKTALLERAFGDRNLLKFEGLENLAQEAQLRQAKKDLVRYVSDPALELVRFADWGDFFEALSKYVGSGRWTIYLEKLQWLCSYNTDLVSYLKYYWDNFFRKNPELVLVLCGSSPSFMAGKVIRSRALYNRSLHTLKLDEFSFVEGKAFFGPSFSDKQVLDALLTVGGVPEYLSYLKRGHDPFANLCRQSFGPNGFFVSEYEKVFSSSLGSDSRYREIVEALAEKKYASRDALREELGRPAAGGTFSKLLYDLEESGFIERYQPFHLAEASKTVRYRVRDSFLNFYQRFIRPTKPRILAGDFRSAPASALSLNEYYSWLGLEFEKFCLRYSANIARSLGFSGVKYRVGSFFYRGKPSAGYQLDLVFERADHVYTVCEIKYTRQALALDAVGGFEAKLERFSPPKRGYSIQRVLISAAEVTARLESAHLFDRILGLKDIVSGGA